MTIPQAQTLGARLAIAVITLSAAGFVGIAANEGFTDRAVIPVKGDVPTIGFGTTQGVRLGDKITPQRALARALTDVSKFEGGVKQCVHVPLHQYEYDAYVDFAYNIGVTKFCASTMVKKLNAGDYAGACGEFDRWSRGPGGVDCRDRANNCYGLVERRSRERSACLGEAK